MQSKIENHKPSEWKLICRMMAGWSVHGKPRRTLPQRCTRRRTHASFFSLSLSRSLYLKFDVYLDMFKCYSVYTASTVDLVKTKPMLSSFFSVHSSKPTASFSLLLFLLLLLLLGLVCCALPFFRGARACSALLWIRRLTMANECVCTMYLSICMICIHKLRSLSHRYQVMCTAYLWFLHLPYGRDGMNFSVRLGFPYRIIVVFLLCFRLELSEVSAQIHVKSISSSVAVNW